LGLLHRLTEMLQVPAQHEVVLHLLVEPDGDEAAEVDVGAEAAEEHLGGAEGRQLGEADLANVQDPLTGELGRLDGVEIDVPAQVPARPLHADEELVIEHGTIIPVQKGQGIRPRGDIIPGYLSGMDNMATANSRAPRPWSVRPGGQRSEGRRRTVAPCSASRASMKSRSLRRLR